MKKQFYPIALSALLAASAANSATVTIAFDKSASNPLLSDPNFAASAAEFVAEHVEPLKDGDIVRIRNFGARDVASNMLDQDFKLNRRLRGPQLAASIKSHIAGLAGQSAQAQSSTNIIAFLEFEDLDCANGGTVLLLSDGLEASGYMSPQAFLDGTASLPAPDVSLKGCRVILYGLGAGLPAQSVRFIRKEWTTYITSAGGEFTAVIK